MFMTQKKLSIVFKINSMRFIDSKNHFGNLNILTNLFKMAQILNMLPGRVLVSLKSIVSN